MFNSFLFAKNYMIIAVIVHTSFSKAKQNKKNQRRGNHDANMKIARRGKSCHHHCGFENVEMVFNFNLFSHALWSEPHKYKFNKA